MIDPLFERSHIAIEKSRTLVEQHKLLVERLKNLIVVIRLATLSESSVNCSRHMEDEQ